MKRLMNPTKPWIKNSYLTEVCGVTGALLAVLIR